MDTFKQRLVSLHQQLLQDKIDAFQDMIAGLASDAQNDAKSSAGDKHETALSMMHLEQEKLNHKLAEYNLQKQKLQKVDVNVVSETVVLGSLVQTNGLLIFISEALPKVVIDGSNVFAVSVKSPLGSQLMGKKQHDKVSVNEVIYTIENIL